MGSIAMQHFLSLYPRISGMTGTASTAADEFREFYGRDVVVVPTNKPCIRKDYPDIVFSDKNAKQSALIAEIKNVHLAGRPVLIGTGSVEESELLAAKLRVSGILCRVLNAKNDEMEAKITARAGELGAVTVSTNMAGRGIDIRLGGEFEQDRDRVVALGGLYVIGTNRHESRRIDNQLRGRAGRQGDPGESRFFISLEDDWIKRYDIVKLIPGRKTLVKQDGQITDPTVLRAVERGQRIIEGYNSDIRRQLWKYSFLIEQQRRIVHDKRQDILMDRVPLNLLASKAADRYCALRDQVGEDVLRTVEKQISLWQINKCWADYLEYINYEREGIHLVAVGKKDPLTELHRIAIEAFDAMLAKFDSEIIRTFATVEVGKDGLDMDKAGLEGPAATWTYLIDDRPDQFSRLPGVIKAAIDKLGKPAFSLQSLWRRIPDD
jgi:Preprotein translocase subunit SecA (ATPase, RNA helicase)